MPLSRRFIETFGLLVAYAAGLVLLAAALSFATPRVPVTINVRWAPALADADRPGLESRFTLSGGQHTEGTTWRYTLTDTSFSTIKALVTHPSVEDTSNIDRVDFRALAIPRPVTRRSLAFAVAGALLLLAGRRYLQMPVFWGVAAALAVAAVLAARTFPPAGQVLLTRPHWMLAAGIAALAVLPAVRASVPISGVGLRVIVAVPQVVLLVLVGAATALAWVGVAPFWRDPVRASLPEAAYEGDRVEVTRLLAGGADPRAETRVDGQARSALEAAIESGDDVTLDLLLRATGPLDAALRTRLEDVAEHARNPGAVKRLGGR